MADNFQKIMKVSNPQTQETQRTVCKIITHTHAHTHAYIRVKEIKKRKRKC